MGNILPIDTVGMLIGVALLYLALAGSSLGKPTPEDCQDDQFHPDPDNCPEGYFRCDEDGNGGWNIEEHLCPAGTAFHPELQICDWPGPWVDQVCDDATHAPTHEPTDHPTIPTDTPEGGKVIVCYYSSWELVAYDPWFDLAPNDEGCDRDHCHYDSFRRFNKLKQKNPKLKTLLSIGGWNSGSGQWSEMAIDPAKRKTFVNSCV